MVGRLAIPPDLGWFGTQLGGVGACGSRFLVGLGSCEVGSGNVPGELGPAGPSWPAAPRRSVTNFRWAGTFVRTSRGFPDLGWFGTQLGGVDACGSRFLVGLGSCEVGSGTFHRRVGSRWPELAGCAQTFGHKLPVGGHIRPNVAWCSRLGVVWYPTWGCWRVWLPVFGGVGFLRGRVGNIHRRVGSRWPELAGCARRSVTNSRWAGSFVRTSRRAPDLGWFGTQLGGVGACGSRFLVRLGSCEAGSGTFHRRVGSRWPELAGGAWCSRLGVVWYPTWGCWRLWLPVLVGLGSCEVGLGTFHRRVGSRWPVLAGCARRSVTNFRWAGTFVRTSRGFPDLGWFGTQLGGVGVCGSRFLVRLGSCEAGSGNVPTGELGPAGPPWPAAPDVRSQTPGGRAHSSERRVVLPTWGGLVPNLGVLARVAPGFWWGWVPAKPGREACQR